MLFKICVLTNLIFILLGLFGMQICHERLVGFVRLFEKHIEAEWMSYYCNKYVVIKYFSYLLYVGICTLRVGNIVLLGRALK